MRKTEKQGNDKALPSKREWSRLRRIPRLAVYGFGVITLL